MKYISSLFALALFMLSCENKPELPTAAVNSNQKYNDTSYIQLNPVWTGFHNPSDVYVGSDNFIYVADTDSNRIVMMDLAGRLIGYSKYIKNPTKISEDAKFNLLVCGEKDTVINSKTITIGAIYRIDLHQASHFIQNCDINLVYSQADRPERRFTGIAVFKEKEFLNSYLVTRVGPNNQSIVDPDNAILLMKDDKILSPMSFVRIEGNALGSIMDLSGVAINASTKDFAIAQTGAEMQYKSQWFTYYSGENSNWGQKFDPTKTTADYLTINRFSKPCGITFDNSGNLFVVDSEKDSVFKFTSSAKGKELIRRFW